MEIKNPNIEIRREIYPQIWKKGSSQTKLLSTLYFKEGYLNMAILEPKAQTVKKA